MKIILAWAILVASAQEAEKKATDLLKDACEKAKEGGGNRRVLLTFGAPG